jgi:hypothetical protein
MNFAGTPLFTTMLGLAGTFLGLAILVQVIQEGWKYLLSTKSGAYERALFQFIGPWARQLSRTGVLADLEVNGPFQIWRRRPRGKLMPLAKPELVEALERTAPPWVRRTLETLRVEAAATVEPKQVFSIDRMHSFLPPTPALTALVKELATAERGSPGYATANDVSAFLKTWGIGPGPELDHLMAPSGSLNTGALLSAFRERFLPHVTKAERTFDQLTSNFDYLYKRRNTLLTMTIALGVTLFADLPVGRLYREAASMTPAEAGGLAESMTRLYDSIPPGTPANDSVRARAARIRGQAIEELNRRIGLGIDPRLGSATDRTWFSGIVARLSAVVSHVRADGALYLLECLATALLISFGAPFWNDLAGTLLRLQRGPPKESKTEGKG